METVMAFSPSGTCPGFRHGIMSRRHLLRVVGLGGLALSGVRPAGAAPRRKPTARAVIFLHQYGGPSQLDTFDPKPPPVPEEIRGPFRPIASRVPGVAVCEGLPRLARLADKFTLIRSLTHEMKFHNSAGYYSLTGRAPAVDDIGLRDVPELFPAYGSVVDRLAPGPEGVPTFVALPHVLRDGDVTPGQHASFLGKGHNPLLVTHDPNLPDFSLPELSLPAGLTPSRLEDRRQIMQLLDRQTDLLETSAVARGIGQLFDKALALVTKPEVRRAFDLSLEPPKLRERYGRTTYGQSCLLSRRLVEAGVRFVNVYFSGIIGGGGNFGGWDTHGFNSHPMEPILKDYLLPLTDQAVSALLEDLDTRGLLAGTLVVWMGEFGRTPRINQHGGRDHWPKCATALLAGGGVKSGYVHGASDRTGAYPASDPVRPEDMAATLFGALGIDPASEITDVLGRPLPVSTGTRLEGVLA
jgi:hypothetical protein